MLSSMLASGALDGVLAQHGWKKTAASPSASSVTEQQARQKSEGKKQEQKSQAKNEVKRASEAIAKPLNDAGWQEQKRKKTSAAAPAAQQEKPKLLPVNWKNATVKDSVKDLQVGVPAVCLATTAEARQAMRELKTSGSLAVLAPNPVEGKGEKVSVAVATADGKKDQLVRFLI